MINRSLHRVAVLLKLRRQHEIAAKQSFAAAEEQVRRRGQEIASLRMILRRENTLARRRLLGGAGGMELTTYQQSIREIRAALVGGTERLREAKAELARRRAALLAALRQKDVADSLHFRISSRLAGQRARSEIKVIDDVHASWSGGAKAGEPKE